MRQADAAILLQGDGFARCAETARLFKERLAPLIVISGGVSAPERGAVPAQQLADELVRLGVPVEHIRLENRSLNTREQAINVIEMAEREQWLRLSLVASNFHHYRAYLTFLRRMDEVEAKLLFFSSPARDLPWFGETAQGKRVDLLKLEFAKVEEYRAKYNHVASYARAIEYQKWKEEQL